MSDNKLCEHCGAAIPADSLFCERCGQPLAAAPAEPPYEPVAMLEEPTRASVPPPSPPKRRVDVRLLISVIGTSVAVILLLATVAGPGLTSITANVANHAPSAAAPVTANATPSAAAHDTFLASYLAQYKDTVYSSGKYDVKAWNVEWLNRTSARLQLTAYVKSDDQTVTENRTYVVFPTTEDATAYVRGLDKTGYNLKSTEYTSGTYEKVRSHVPQVYLDYERYDGNPANISEYHAHEIWQMDNLVVVMIRSRVA
jgi:hypothetical protein